MTRPPLRERLKPLELVGFAAVLGLFAAVVALVGTRAIDVALILGGIAFIVALLVLAMLALTTGTPDDGDPDVPVLDRERPPKKRR